MALIKKDAAVDDIHESGVTDAADGDADAAAWAGVMKIPTQRNRAFIELLDLAPVHRSLVPISIRDAEFWCVFFAFSLVVKIARSVARRPEPRASRCFL